MTGEYVILLICHMTLQHDLKCLKDVSFWRIREKTIIMNVISSLSVPYVNITVNVGSNITTLNRIQLLCNTYTYV